MPGEPLPEENIDPTPPTHYEVLDMNGNWIEYTADRIDEVSALYKQVAEAGMRSSIRGIVREEQE